jgi:hypothetical protein
MIVGVASDLIRSSRSAAAAAKGKCPWSFEPAFRARHFDVTSGSQTDGYAPFSTARTRKIVNLYGVRQHEQKQHEVEQRQLTDLPLSGQAQ